MAIAGGAAQSFELQVVNGQVKRGTYGHRQGVEMDMDEAVRKLLEGEIVFVHSYDDRVKRVRERVEKALIERHGKPNHLDDAQVFALVRAELAKARTRYPWWPADLVHACAIANEESGEVVKAVNNRYWAHGTDTLDDIRKEAVQAIAMWVRMLTESQDVDDATLARNLAEQGKSDADELGKAWPSLEAQPNGVDIFAGVYPVSGEPGL